MTTTTQATIESLAAARDEFHRLKRVTEDFQQVRVINAEISRLNLAISYLYHRSRR